MFDISFGELLICAVIALLVLGPDKLPGTVRTVGRWIGRARHTVNQFTDQIDREIRSEEMKKRIEEQMRLAGVEKSVMDDVTKQVSDALRAPLPLVGADHLREPAPENRIAPPATATAAPAIQPHDDDGDADRVSLPATAAVTAATPDAASIPATTPAPAPVPAAPAATAPANAPGGNA